MTSLEALTPGHVASKIDSISLKYGKIPFLPTF